MQSEEEEEGERREKERIRKRGEREKERVRKRREKERVRDRRERECGRGLFGGHMGCLQEKNYSKSLEFLLACHKYLG